MLLSHTYLLILFSHDLSHQSYSLSLILFSLTHPIPSLTSYFLTIAYSLTRPIFAHSLAHPIFSHSHTHLILSRSHSLILFSLTRPILFNSSYSLFNILFSHDHILTHSPYFLTLTHSSYSLTFTYSSYSLTIWLTHPILIHSSYSLSLILFSLTHPILSRSHSLNLFSFTHPIFSHSSNPLSLTLFSFTHPILPCILHHSLTPLLPPPFLAFTPSLCRWKPSELFLDSGTGKLRFKMFELAESRNNV